jgi:phosphohistidine phosphatase
MRHANSSWALSNLADRNRPLSVHGERDAPKMARRMLTHTYQPSLIISSPAVRALTTAKIVGETLGYALRLIHTEEKLYMATADEILAVVSVQKDNYLDLLLVGHNPGMTNLANILLPHLVLDNMPTASLLTIEFMTDHWARLAKTQGQLVYFDCPRNCDLLITGKKKKTPIKSEMTVKLS